TTRLRPAHPRTPTDARTTQRPRHLGTHRPARSHRMSLTEYPELEQRSDEWFTVRCGLVTASMVGKLLTVSAPSAGAYMCSECAAPAGEPCISKRGGTAIKTMHSERVALAAQMAATADPVLTVADNDTSRGILTTLAAERITGHVEETPMTSAMWRGVEEEPFARDAYEKHHAPVVEMGFMVRDFGKFRIGLSPDGLVGDDGLIEIKSRAQKKQVQTILADEVPAENYAQLQCALLVPGRRGWDYVSFSTGRPLYVKRVYAENSWLIAIKQAAKNAEQQIADTVARYQAAVVGLPATERIPDLD